MAFFFFSTAFAAVSKTAGCFVKCSSHRNARGSVAWVTVPNEQNICRCFVNEVWHRDHPISDEGVLQSQQLREKIRQARLLVVCGMGTAAKCDRLFAQHINCWIQTLGTCSLLVKFSGELVASSLNKVIFFGRCDGPECFHVDDEDMRSSGGRRFTQIREFSGKMMENI